jgi:hypothetical protein
MHTDTPFQLIDRMAIAKLKAYHYGKAGLHEQQIEAEKQAQVLADNGDVLIAGIAHGLFAAPLHKHLRFHDHGAAENQDLSSASRSIMGVAGELALTHARYWSLQTDIQEIKKQLDRVPGEEGDAADILNEAFVEKQRQIDVCNQRRNELVQAGDALLAECFTSGVVIALEDDGQPD